MINEKKYKNKMLQVRRKCQDWNAGQFNGMMLAYYISRADSSLFIGRKIYFISTLIK
jgi:hypothetical protein